MRLTSLCPFCSKILELSKQTDLGEQFFNSYKCGHSFFEDKPKGRILNFHSLDNSKEEYEYQKEGTSFIIKSSFNCILGDEMRLGKTPQALKAAANSPEVFPILIIVRAANIYQWLREYKTWVDALPMGVWIIQGTKNWIPPGFSAYIISMDTFSRPGRCELCGHSGSNHQERYCTKKSKDGKLCGCNNFVEKDSMVSKLLTFGFKLVIVDELHHFKNADSNRSQALVSFLQRVSHRTITKIIPIHCTMCDKQWEENTTIELVVRKGFGSGKHHHNTQCPVCGTKLALASSKAELIKDETGCGIVMLSGTPIKNRANEYFVPLNLVAPDVFPSQAHFQQRWLDYDGKRIKPYLLDEFKKVISPYFLRREKEDVYEDLPKFNRMFTVITIDDEKLKTIYNEVLDKIELELVKPNFSYFSTIGELAHLRQICGLGKVDWTADYIDTCLEDANGKRPKYAIGVHHHSVRDALSYKLSRFGVCKLDGTDSPETKDRIAHSYFESSPEQILILGMMAAKEGIELVYLPNAIVLEREWSAAEEEQFEYRFYNPNLEYLERRGLKDKITNIEYILAKGTVDEFFYDLVEEKRKIFGETISNHWSLENDNGSFRQLMERTVSSRL
jgi:SNF2 family DNA or RNA helicase